MRNNILFWDVDTQYDFMRLEGKLYVPGAEDIIEKISHVRRFALENGFSIVASTDWHSSEDAEISDDPDFKQTFGPHCIANEPGSERVGYLGELPIEYIPNSKMDTDALKKLSDKERFHIVIRKQVTDVFSNPMLRIIERPTFFSDLKYFKNIGSLCLLTNSPVPSVEQSSAITISKTFGFFICDARLRKALESISFWL